MYGINNLIDQMSKGHTATDVVDHADAQLRASVTTGEDAARAVSLGAMKVQLAFALEEIVRLRKSLATYEEIKADSENDSDFNTRVYSTAA